MLEAIIRFLSGAPDPRLEAIQRDFGPTASVSRNLLRGVYEGRNVSIHIEHDELSCWVSCNTAIGFEAKNRTRMPLTGNEVPRHSDLPNVYFRSYEPQAVQTWLDGLANTSDLTHVFGHNDAELEMKPHKQSLEVEWDHLMTSNITEAQLKELAAAMCRIAQSLES